MSNELGKSGFSLTEVLLAVGTLAIGLLFIAGTFMAGIHFSTIATEQTIAAVASDEAFAKIKIYGINLNDPNLLVGTLRPFETVVLNPINAGEFAYPSTSTVTEKQYYWSALCRRTDPNLVQVTVFVCRKVGSGTTYQGGMGRPIAISVSVVSGTVGNKVLTIETGKKTFINDGYTIVDNQTGQIYRVVNRRGPPDENVIELDRNWAGPSAPLAVWVVPPPISGGRHPCIAVYQKVIRF